mgnify:CR=1 FL=1
MKSSLNIWLPLLAFVSCTACSDERPPEVPAKEIVARVYEIDTWKPIEGALVLVNYTGARGPHAATACNQSEVYTTDARGEVRFVSGDRYGAAVVAGALKDGYVWARHVYEGQDPSVLVPLTDRLLRRAANKEEWLDELRRLSAQWCGGPAIATSGAKAWYERILQLRLEAGAPPGDVKKAESMLESVKSTQEASQRKVK